VSAARGARGSPRFLVIRRDNIGDLVCTTPLLAALRAQYPGAWIGVLANHYNAPVLEGNPDIDHVFAYRKAKHGGVGLFTNAWQRMRMLAHVRRERLDFAIAATPGAQPRALRLARLLGAKQIIAFVPKGQLAAGVDVAIAPDDADDLSETELVWRLAPALGLSGEPPPARVVPADEVVQRARSALALKFWSERGPLVGIHVSARKPSQRWPIERFAELMRTLHARDDARFMLFWAPGDAATPTHPGDDAKANALLDATRDLPVLAWPTTELRELIGGLAVCDRMVMADGGAMHIAAALGKPIVAFFGKSDARRWRPWRVPCELLQPSSQDVADLAVADALAGYDRLIRHLRSASL
jgi:heptosyltransferase III